MNFIPCNISEGMTRNMIRQALFNTALGSNSIQILIKEFSSISRKSEKIFIIIWPNVFQKRKDISTIFLKGTKIKFYNSFPFLRYLETQRLYILVHNVIQSILFTNLTIVTFTTSEIPNTSKHNRKSSKHWSVCQIWSIGL